MARFFGEIGYATTVESPANSGVYKETIVEKHYYGDVLQVTRRLDASQTVNPDIKVSNSLSVIADAYANQNFMAIRYVRWNGVLWTVSTVTVQRPRLILELGGVYNVASG